MLPQRDLLRCTPLVGRCPGLEFRGVFFAVTWVLLAVPLVGGALLTGGAVNVAGDWIGLGPTSSPSATMQPADPPTVPPSSSSTPNADQTLGGSSGAPSGDDSVNATTAPGTTATSSRSLSPISVRVVNTCGASGDGDCFLSERAGPRGSADELRQWDNGDQLKVLCQVHGTSAYSSVLGRSSDVWSQTTDGGWVASIYLDGVSKTSITTPC